MKLTLRFFTFVRRLFLPCRPSAVTGFIMTIHIDSVQRMLRRWWLAHVGKEVFKGHPRFAYFDAPASVVVKRPPCCIITSRAHLRPGFVGLCMMPFPRMVVAGARLIDFATQASAGLRWAVGTPQLVQQDGDFAATIASRPDDSHALARSFADDFQHREPVKFLSDAFRRLAMWFPGLVCLGHGTSGRAG